MEDYILRMMGDQGDGQPTETECIVRFVDRVPRLIAHLATFTHLPWALLVISELFVRLSFLATYAL